MQIVRSKSNTGTREEKQTVMYTIGHTLLQTLKIFSPIAPFTTEAIYQNLKQEYNLEKESIHLYEWPKTKEEKIDGDLEKNLEKAQDIIKSVSRLRQQSQISNRWPLQEVIIETENDEIKESIKMMKDIIKRQTNVKEINIVSKMSDVEKIIEPDYSVLGPKHGKQVEKVAQKLSNQDPDNVISEIEENNYYQLEEGLEINREDFEIKTEVPEEYNQTNLNKESNIYINKERNKDLKTEGYANELMRHIQQQRKENDLEKKDDIRLYVKTSSNMKERLEVFEEQISDRVGATEIKINDEKPNEEYQFSSEEEIKEEIFEIYITKVS